MKLHAFLWTTLWLVLLSVFPRGAAAAGSENARAKRLAEKCILAGEAQKIPVPSALLTLKPEIADQHRIVVRAILRAAEAERYRKPVRQRIIFLEVALQLRESFTEALQAIDRQIDESLQRLEWALQRQNKLSEEIGRDIDKERHRADGLRKLRHYLLGIEDLVDDHSAGLTDLPLSRILRGEIWNSLQNLWNQLRRSSRPEDRRGLYRRLMAAIDRYLENSRRSFSELRNDIEKMRDVRTRSRDDVMVDLAPLLDECIQKNIVVNLQYRAKLRELRDLDNRL